MSSLPNTVAGDGYFENTRDDVVALLPRPAGRTLDVGCGAGTLAPGLRAAGASELHGVELMPEQAERARAGFDVVHTGTIEAALEELEGPFDTILCLDLLEHLADPYSVLRALRGLAAPGGHLQLSVPNARHFSLVRDLVLKGTFGYTEWGHRDATHLRWFTRRDLIEAVTEAGWTPVRVSHPAMQRGAALDRLTRGRSTEFLVGQWYLTAAAR
ncbi:MAG: class I SAM-dependent methyltransferase [Solirubrobacterales bacterium]|nr:class I SAM-dependent methyltransferase [Solirubrobacterales bacterium]